MKFAFGMIWISLSVQHCIPLEHNSFQNQPFELELARRGGEKYRYLGMRIGWRKDHSIQIFEKKKINVLLFF